MIQSLKILIDCLYFHSKILLNEANDSKFVRRKWNTVNDLSNTNYDVGNEINYNTKISKSNLCDYNYAYISVTGYITVVAGPTTQASFKNCALFTKCMKKIGGTTIDDAGNLDLVMPMYNLIAYSSNYSKTIGSLWFCLMHEAAGFNADIDTENNFKCFRYKAKLLESREAQSDPNDTNGILKNATIAVPLKYLSNFLRSIGMPLVNCKVELKLK